MSKLVGNSGRWDGPWNCPYCDYKSPRKGNARMHVDRRHKGFDNPYYYFPPEDYPNLRKRITFADSTGKLGNRSISPQFNPDNPMQWSIELQNILKRIEGMSDFELNALLLNILRKLLDRPSS